MVRRLVDTAVRRAMKVAHAAIALAMVAGGPAGAQVLVAIELGNSWDWLVGSNPLFAEQNSTQFAPISAASDPFASAPFTGPVRLSVTCCKDQLTGNPVQVPGVAFDVQPAVCREPPFSTESRPPITAGEIDRRLVVALPICASAPDTTVNVAPGNPSPAFLRFRAGAAAPGTFIATLFASWSGGQATRDIFASVAPAPWPADGPAPACLQGVTALSLASIRPPPPAGKRNSMASSSYPLAAAFPSGTPATGAGLQMTFVPASTTGPIPPTSASVSLTNAAGRPIGVRTIDSRNCAATSPQIVVPAGQTRSISFGAATTTTLVFMKSTCRAWADWFDCWGGSALGMDDIVVLSEGPFWALLGGRRVNATSVGDWGALRRPNSVAIIQTP